MKDMINPKIKDRPDCKNILENKNKWSLGMDKIIDDKKKKEISSGTFTIEDSFHRYFLQKKILHEKL
jgi:hypothetical protein